MAKAALCLRTRVGKPIKAMRSARWAAPSPQLASAMLTGWRTPLEQTFRMSRGTTFRMPILQKIKSALSNWN